MKPRTTIALALLVACLLLPSAARAQLSIDWYTIDGGGGTSTGGTLTLSGTIGQPDTGSATGGALAVLCGFWAVAGGAPCPADTNGDGQLTSADVAVFVTRWFDSLQNGTLAGDFDGNGVVQSADVGAFVSAWFAALTGGGC